jgi:biotin synthase
MGGREVNLGERQHLVFAAGADGTMVGNYLTSAGTSPEALLRMIREQGLRVRAPDEPGRWAFRGEAPRGQAAWNRRAAQGDRSLTVLR